MIDFALPGKLSLSDLLYWLSQYIYITRMQLVIVVVSTAVFSWVASRFFTPHD